jgi:hypothetical protein
MSKPTRIRAQPRSVVVNTSTSTIVVDFEKFAVLGSGITKEAPIDEYYRGATELIRESSTETCTEHGRKLLVVQLVACVERYVRTLLVALVETCPACRRNVQRKQVMLAAVAYYPSEELAFAVLDHQALSGGAEIAKATQQMAGIELKQGSSVAEALAAFDRVCHLRHAIVHQGGRLGPNNLLEIGVKATHPAEVAIDGIGFQELVAVCHAAVRAYNQFTFESIIERWAREGSLTAQWDQDQTLFERLCTLFLSKIDRPNVVAQDEYMKMWGG